MTRLLALALLVLLPTSCATTASSETTCQARIDEARAAYDASEAELARVGAEAEKSATPEMFGKVASAAADVAGAKAELDSAKQGCGALR